MAVSNIDNTSGAGESLKTGFDKVNQAITRVNQFDALSTADIAQLGVYASVLLTSTELNRLDGDLATVQGNLGLAIGSDVQAWNEGLDEISGLIPFANDFLVYDTEWKAKTPAQSRLALNVYSKSESDLRYLQQGGASLAGVGLTWNVTSEKLDVNADLSHVTGLGTLTELTVGNINKNGGIVYTDANGKLQNSSNATLGASGKATLNSLEVTTTSNLIGNVTLGNQASTTSHAVRADRLISAGNGLTGGGNLISDRTLTLGTPSTLTVSTTNNASASSHTHTLDLSGRKLTIANDSDNIITWGSLNEQNLGSDRTWTPTLRDAGKNVRGVVSAGTQTFGGVKTFSDVGTFETDLYVDRNLYVKGGLFATEFIVNQTRVQFDNAMSVGGGKISTVSGSVGSEVITFEDENGTKFVPVAENDIIHIQKRTGFASGTIIKNIWRRVTGINGNLIQLGTSNISWSTSNDVGVVIAGDDCVVKGNTTNAARQHYTLYDLSSAKAPRRIMYDNVTDVEDDGDIVLMDGNMDGNYGISGREFGMAVGDTSRVGNHFVLTQNEGSLKMDTFNLSAGSGSNFVGVNSDALPFFAGATNNSGASAKFSVTKAGKLTATSGLIGNWTINDKKLSNFGVQLMAESTFTYNHYEYGDIQSYISSGFSINKYNYHINDINLLEIQWRVGDANTYMYYDGFSGEAGIKVSNFNLSAGNFAIDSTIPELFITNPLDEKIIRVGDFNFGSFIEKQNVEVGSNPQNYTPNTNASITNTDSTILIQFGSITNNTTTTIARATRDFNGIKGKWAKIEFDWLARGYNAEQLGEYAVDYSIVYPFGAVRPSIIPPNTARDPNDTTRSGHVNTGWVFIPEVFNATISVIADAPQGGLTVGEVHARVQITNLSVKTIDDTYTYTEIGNDGFRSYSAGGRNIIDFAGGSGKLTLGSLGVGEWEFKILQSGDLGLYFDGVLKQTFTK